MLGKTCKNLRNEFRLRKLAKAFLHRMQCVKAKMQAAKVLRKELAKEEPIEQIMLLWVKMCFPIEQEYLTPQLLQVSGAAAAPACLEGYGRQPHCRTKLSCESQRLRSLDSETVDQGS